MPHEGLIRPTRFLVGAHNGEQMANPEHVAILQQGVLAWNDWRERFPQILPDLSEEYFDGALLQDVNFQGVNLAGAELNGVNLFSANLRFAKIRGANLIGSYLHQADLTEADLSHANLEGRTDLIEAVLRRTVFHGAVLSEARLDGADFTDATMSHSNLMSATFNNTRLRGADFGGSQLSETSFLDVDLSEVRGLEAVEHHGPSNIGMDTIYKSQGKIPEIFLRGAGVSEEFIALARSIAGADIVH
jgi:hypothetical protein